jgi:hypothetical protein
MADILGVDYSTARPDSGLLARSGKHFAGRYVGPGSDGKHLHAAELASLFDAGLSVVLLAEGSERDALQGATKGRLHAHQALDAANALGAPSDVPIYFAVDFDTATSNWPLVRDYFRGVISVLGISRVGVYGEYDVMTWAARDRIATWFFQTYAWSYGKWYPGNHLEQYQNHVNLGGSVDLCRAKKTDYGQWSREDRDMLFIVLEDSTAGMSSGVAYRLTPDYEEYKRWRATWPNVKEVHIKRADLEAGLYGVPVTMLPGNVTEDRVREIAREVVDDADISPAK